MEAEDNKNNDGKIIEKDIEKEMKTAYIDYAMSVIVSRALPDVRDGLKPVHRRILYAMYEDGITSDKPYRKCANTVGSVLGRYHPHGDASVYDAMVRMAQDFSLRYPLIDGHGNFGSIDGDGAAAMRYTEARMAKIAETMLTDIEKNTVDFMPNYDDRLQEPTVLPSKIPTLLINGSSGIAVGMATNIPPHNLTEVINGIIKIIDEDNVTDEEASSFAVEMLTRMNLPNPENIMKSYPFELSGGMRQRVGIAMAIIFRPELLLADEPTSALDVTTQAQIVKELMEIPRTCGTAMIVVTHNIGVAAYMSDKIMVMKQGKVVEYGKAEDIINSPQAEYTKTLLASVPQIGGQRYV